MHQRDDTRALCREGVGNLRRLNPLVFLRVTLRQVVVGSGGISGISLFAGASNNQKDWKQWWRAGWQKKQGKPGTEPDAR